MESLSDIELYYSSPEFFFEKGIVINGEEVKHITKVMRHVPGDTVYVTNGTGSIFKSVILILNKENVLVKPLEEYTFENKLSNIHFCIPKLKSSERFEFALEKCAEMGISNFIIYESSRTFTKGQKTERWNKILLAAMKQSLRSFLPRIEAVTSLREIASMRGEKIIFEQHSPNVFKGYQFEKNKDFFLIFGPEGGISEQELTLFANSNIFNLAENRLRSETAIIKAASLL